MIDLKILPKSSGVYLFKDIDGNIIYIGKAKNLKERVSSYFHDKSKSLKITHLVSKIKDIDYILTNNEKEALILEANLIKKYKPRYNIYFRDDKKYIYLSLIEDTEYPYLKFTRKEGQGLKLYGPYTSANSARDTLKIINKFFKLRKCKLKTLKKRESPCLQYHMGRCFAPCVLSVDKKKYQKEVKEVKLFLEGKKDELIDVLKKEMFLASSNLEFEKAANLRDKIKAVEKTLEKQFVEFNQKLSVDVIIIYIEQDITYFGISCIRKGKLFENYNYKFQNKFFDDEKEHINNIISQFYLTKKYLPDCILTPFNIDKKKLNSIFKNFFNKEVKFLSLKSEYKKVLDIAWLNLVKKNDSFFYEWPNKIFTSIEIVDVSHFYGLNTYVGVVRFEGGAFIKDKYRLYKFGNLNNDFLVVKKFLEKRIEKKDLPDLFVIDGGKAYLDFFQKELTLKTDKDIQVIAIAKGEKRSKGYLKDKIYASFSINKEYLRPGSPLMLFIQKLRDEAHRFVLQAQRKSRFKSYLKGDILLGLEGIGPRTAKMLWTNFKTLENIKLAEIQELVKIPGIGLKKAKKIKEQLNRLG